MKIRPNIAYHCATDKLAKQFLKEAEEQNYDISDIKNLKWRDCCFSVGKYNSIFWGFTEEYKDEKYKMVEYTGKNATDIDVNTKEEAEFVAKNHDIRVEKFEPPFELGKLGYEFNSKKWGTVEIEKDDVDNYYTVRKFEGFEYFNTYQEAVDYAHKLFKGEE